MGQDIIDKYTSFTIRDDLPNGVTYKSARILDQNGNQMSSVGTINHSSGVVTYTAGNWMLQSGIQYEGERYTLEITVVANNVGTRTDIANSATRSINNDSGTSNTVRNSVVPSAVPPPVTPPPPPPPNMYNITAYHVHSKTGTVILTEYAQVEDGDPYSFSSKSNLTNADGYKYIPLAPTTRSGTATADTVVYLYYDLPLVDLGLKQTRIYTDDQANGLPVTIEFDPKWIDATSVTELAGYTATIRITNMTNGLVHTVTHPLTTMTYTGRIPANRLSGALRDRYEISFTVSNSDYIVRRPGNIQLYGYRASKQVVDATSNSLSYTGVVMTQNTVGGAEQAFNETLAAYTSPLPLIKTGYGFRLEMTYTYTNNLTAATEIAGLNTIPASSQPVKAMVDPVLIDSHVNFKDALNPATDHPKGTVSLVGTGNRSGRMYTETYELPELRIESNTGNLFTLEQQVAGDSRIQYALKPAGKKLYVPVWADVGVYDYRFESVGTPRGANKVRFVLRRDMNVHAHMFSHIDSGTPDDDELLLTPLSPEEAERASDPWYKQY